MNERFGAGGQTQRCDFGTPAMTWLTCWPQPSAFSRYAIYAAIGLLEVIGLFLVSLKVERRMRRRHYAPEWQR